MGSACVLSRAQVGLLAPQVRVEVHVGGGLPQFGIVGLPAPVVRESKDRVRAALASAGYDFPAGRLTVNLAPAELPKEGGRFDLPIALGILLASGQVRARVALGRHEFYGELGLGGELKRAQGLLPTALQADVEGQCLCVPAANAGDLALAGVKLAGLTADLAGAVAFLAGVAGASVVEPAACAVVLTAEAHDLADVRGQAMAKRALLIAAAGGHHLLLRGPPGAGKSLLARRLPGLLPPLEPGEHREVAAIHSLRSATSLEPAQPPFRAPHHTASAHAIVGGGPRAAPGEISLAHRGVLFLDELPEFDRRVLEALREPLESGEVSIVRAGFQARYPAQFQLVAAMNPCPCGRLGRSDCDCTPGRLQQYRSKLSAPLLDRIDLRLRVDPVGVDLWRAGPPAPEERSSALAVRVGEARSRQRQRQGCLNARLGAAATMEACALTPTARRTLERVAAKHELSARAVHRVARVARTIADLEAAPAVAEAAVAEALSLRFD